MTITNINRLKKFCKKYSVDIDALTKYQIAQIYAIYDSNISHTVRTDEIFEYILHNVISDVDWIEMIRKSRSIKGVTIEKFNIRYGKEVGETKWKSYCDKQALTNTFEYKAATYGWDEKQFSDYNKSRSVTLKNLIMRYGKEVGETKWKSYCDKQAINGCTLEYFQEKYGKIEGKKKYKEIGSKKAHTYDNYVKWYGEDSAMEMLEKKFNTLNSKFFSKISQELFWEIYKQVEEYQFKSIYFAELNKEFGRYDYANKKYCFFDFVIHDIKLIVEFFGDHFHGNPKLYKPNSFLKAKGQTTKRAKTIWCADKNRIDFIKSIGYNSLIIWESDYVNDRPGTVDRILKVINEHYKNI